MSKKQDYINFCNTRKDLPLFVQPKWLDAVCDNWDVAIYKQDNKIVAFLPYTYYKKTSLTVSHNPPLTPYLGIWIDHPKGIKEATKLGNEKEIFQNLLQQLPKFDNFNYNFNPEFTNWYPLYLDNFEQTTRYTYCINQPFSIDAIFNGFKSKLKAHINKAVTELTIDTSSNINDLVQIKKIAHSENSNIPVFKTELYKSVFKLCKKENLGTQLIAKNKDDKIIASVLLVWDSQFCYLLHGASLPEHKSSNAMSLLIWEAIQLAHKKQLSFNFEGSMLESVEQFFRFFNATQTPYFNIRKTNSKIGKFKNFIKSL